MFDAPGPAGGDHRHVHHIAHRFQHLQIESGLYAVGIDAVENDFSSSVGNAGFDPLNSIQPGVLPASLGKNPELPVHPFGVHGQDYALIAVLFCRRRNEGGVPEGPGVDADLVRAAFQHPVEIVYRIDAASHGEGDEDCGGHLRQDVREQRPALGGGGDVVKYQLVCPAAGIELCQFYRGADIRQPQKVDALDHPSVLYVQTGDDALGNHCGPPSRTANAKSTAPAYHALPTMAA